MYRCSEQNCEEKFDHEDDFIVHSSYHEYHQKIKDLGRKELDLLETRLSMRIKCPLEDRDEGLYYFPQLPTRLVCNWYDCQQEFLSAERFYEHVSNHAHRMVDKCYWGTCNKKFKTITQTLLREHLRVHSLQKLYACPSCGNFFSTKIKFDDHFLRHLTVEDFLRSKPNIQPKSITHHKAELSYVVAEYHLGDGNKVKIFKCTVESCDKTFLTSSLLREHIRTHSSKNQCDQCPFTAQTASRLESHKLYRHRTERIHECAICLKTFKQRGDLRAHVKRHQIAEPYRCDKCDFETLNEECLTKHSKLHSKNNEYVCHLCKRAFSRGNNLSRHLKDMHQLEPANGLGRFRYKQTLVGFWILDSIEPSSLHEIEQESSAGLDLSNRIQRVAE